jgi:hypothetical protein
MRVEKDFWLRTWGSNLKPIMRTREVEVPFRGGDIKKAVIRTGVDRQALTGGVHCKLMMRAGDIETLTWVGDLKLLIVTGDVESRP